MYTEQVLKRWAADGHEVTMIGASVAGETSDEVVDGYRVVRLGNKYTVYREARRWWQAVGRYQHFDVVLDMINTVAFGAHKWVGDVPTVGFIHQTCEEIWAINTPWPASVLGRYVLEPRWLRSYRDVPVLAVSASTRDSIMRFGVRDVTVVPEGYEPQPIGELPAKEQAPTVVWCARVVDYKKPYDVLAATIRVHEQMPDLQVWMLGGGPQLEQLRADAPPWFHVLGFVSQEEKVDRMARAHVMVATSVREGWGLVVSEAAALGTPTIGYDVPGLRDSTRAANGVVIPPSPDALADWLPTTLRDWQANPPAPLPYGGAESWDTVAAAVYAAMTEKAGLA